MTCVRNTLPIDLVLADQLFPIMESAAKTLEHLPQLYEDLDHFFWRNFLELFPNRDEPCPPDRAWETLARLRDTAELSIVSEPLIHLGYNNSRISAALASLDIILKR